MDKKRSGKILVVILICAADILWAAGLIYFWKDKNILICVGIIIYIAMSGIDRFVYHIPNVMYIPVAVLGIALILIGFFKDKSK